MLDPVLIKILTLVMILFGMLFSLTLGQTSDGRLTHNARVENCTLFGNSATEFGAAMSVATFHFLDYTGSITPLEIADW